MSGADENAAASPIEGAPAPELTELSSRLRRVIADNGGPFTFTGTCSYIVGRGEVAIVDPGPAGKEAHVAALLDAVRGEKVSHIVVTHTHRDHSPAARALKEATGAPIVGCGPHRAARLGRQAGPARFRGRPRTRARSSDARRATRSRARLDAVGHRDARPYGESSRLHARGGECAFVGRPRDGLVDHDRRPARRLDGRLHGFAATSFDLRPCHLLAGPWGPGARARALCAWPRGAPPPARTHDPRRGEERGAGYRRHRRGSPIPPSRPRSQAPPASRRSPISNG